MNTFIFIHFDFFIHDTQHDGNLIAECTIQLGFFIHLFMFFLNESLPVTGESSEAFTGLYGSQVKMVVLYIHVSGHIVIVNLKTPLSCMHSSDEDSDESCQGNWSRASEMGIVM